MALSDGTVVNNSAMLATQLNHLIENQEIQPNSIIALTKYVCQPVSGRQIIIVLNLEVIDKNHPSVIGTFAFL